MNGADTQQNLKVVPSYLHLMEHMHLDLHTDQRHKLAKEMYLKAIFELQSQMGEVKAVDLVDCLGVTKASVSEMLRKLKDDGFVDYESFKAICLTKKGKQKAHLILRRYHILRSFVERKLGIKGAKAHHEACALEHAFSDEAIEKLERLL
jgi:DtxR family transcriptional regulator, Mn-dependent transcriptional regulator